MCADIDGIYILVGAHPKHALASVQSHLDRLFAQPRAALHVVDYSTDDPMCTHYLKDIVQQYDNMCDENDVDVSNRYLAFSLAESKQLDGSDDLHLLSSELSRARAARDEVSVRMGEAEARIAAEQNDNARTLDNAAEAARNEGEEGSSSQARSKKTPKAKKIDSARPTRAQLLRQEGSGGAGRSGSHAHLSTEAEQTRLLEASLRSRDIGPRAIDPPGEELTSPDWVKRFGFSKGLTPYQVSMRLLTVRT